MVEPRRGSAVDDQAAATPLPGERLALVSVAPPAPVEAIVGGRVVRAGADRVAAAAELLADPVIAFVHTRNVLLGCYLPAMTRG